MAKGDSQRWVMLFANLHGDGIVNVDTGAHLEQSFGNLQAWRVPLIIGPRLERESQQCDGSSFQDEQLLLQLLNHELPLRPVHSQGRLEQLRLISILRSRMQQRLHILAETTAAPSDSSVQEFRA